MVTPEQDHFGSAAGQLLGGGQAEPGGRAGAQHAASTKVVAVEFAPVAEAGAHVEAEAGEARDDRRFDELVDASGDVHCVRLVPIGALVL